MVSFSPRVLAACDWVASAPLSNAMALCLGPVLSPNPLARARQCRAASTAAVEAVVSLMTLPRRAGTPVTAPGPPAVGQPRVLCPSLSLIQERWLVFQFDSFVVSMKGQLPHRLQAALIPLKENQNKRVTVALVGSAPWVSGRQLQGPVSLNVLLPSWSSCPSSVNGDLLPSQGSWEN